MSNSNVEVVLTAGTPAGATVLNLKSGVSQCGKHQGGEMRILQAGGWNDHDLIRVGPDARGTQRAVPVRAALAVKVRVLECFPYRFYTGVHKNHMLQDLTGFGV